MENDSRILELHELPDFKVVAEKFGYPDEAVVEWTLVAKAYQGIIVHNPRRFAGHHTTAWCYGWDCSSGCVWDASAVRSIEVIPNAMEERLLQAGLF